MTRKNSVIPILMKADSQILIRFLEGQLILKDLLNRFFTNLRFSSCVFIRLFIKVNNENKRFNAKYLPTIFN